MPVERRRQKRLAYHYAVSRLSLRSAIVRSATLIAAMAFIGMALAPSRAAAFSKAIWGQLTYNGVNQFPMYKQLGVSIIELDLDWNLVAPTRPRQPTNPRDPAYVWPQPLRQTIAEAARYHMRVLLQIIESPAWANGGHAESGWAPASSGAFVAFAEAAGREYPNVHLWMIWGEPTKAGNFQPLAPAIPGQPLDRAQRYSARLYAEMLDGAYGALKALNRRNLVIGGCTYTTGAVNSLQWIEALRLPNGKPPRMDMYAHNPFSYTDPTFTTLPAEFDDIQFDNLPELARWVDRYLHRGLPLFLSEWTIPTQYDKTFNFWVDPPVAAQWITHAMHESRAWRRIYALGWINVYDDLPLIAGGLLTENGTPKPSFYAFEHG